MLQTLQRSVSSPRDRSKWGGCLYLATHAYQGNACTVSIYGAPMAMTIYGVECPAHVRTIDMSTARVPIFVSCERLCRRSHRKTEFNICKRKAWTRLYRAMGASPRLLRPSTRISPARHSPGQTKAFVAAERALPSVWMGAHHRVCAAVRHGHDGSTGKLPRLY